MLCPQSPRLLHDPLVRRHCRPQLLRRRFNHLGPSPLPLPSPPPLLLLRILRSPPLSHSPHTLNLVLHHGRTQRSRFRSSQLETPPTPSLRFRFGDSTADALSRLLLSMPEWQATALPPLLYL